MDKKFFMALTAVSVILFGSCSNTENISADSVPDAAGVYIEPIHVTEENTEYTTVEPSETSVSLHEIITDTQGAETQETEYTFIKSNSNRLNTNAAVTESTVSETTTAEKTMEKHTENNFKHIYKTFLQNNSDSGDMFDLYDIDSDGVPELFISSGDAHVSGVKIYTLSENNAVCISGENEIGGWGVVQAGSGNSIASGYANQGECVTVNYKKNGNSLNEEIRFRDISAGYAFNEGEITDAYYINDEPVSEETFISEYGKYNGYGGFSANNTLQLGRRYSFNSETLNFVFADENDMIVSPSGFLLDPCFRADNIYDFGKDDKTALLLYYSDNARVYGVGDSNADLDNQTLIIEHDGIAEEFNRMCFIKWGHVELSEADNGTICSSITVCSGTGRSEHDMIYFHKENGSYKMFSVDPKKVISYLNEHIGFEIDNENRIIVFVSDVSEYKCTYDFGSDYDMGNINSVLFYDESINYYTVGRSAWYHTYPYAEVKNELGEDFSFNLNVDVTAEIIFDKTGGYSFGSLRFVPLGE